MDEKKDEQDLTVSDDGVINQGINIEVKTENSVDSEPSVNETQPPPEDIADEDIKDEDVNAVESAVNFIVGGDDASADEEEKAPEPTDEQEVATEPTTEVEESHKESADGVVEQNVADEQDDTTAEGSDEDSVSADAVVSKSTDLDPFAADKPAEAAMAVSGMSNNEQAQPHAHRNNKKLAIIVTVIVALIMAGAAVYVFVSAEDNAEESSTKNSVTVQETKKQEIAPATANDVDQTVSEIDQTLESLDDTSLEEETVSDSVLGL